MRAVLAVLWLIVTIVPALAAGGGEPRRVAVVIGNGSYAIGDLPNPPNDAALVASAFRSLGFDVHQAADLTTLGFDAFFAEVSAAATDADVLFVYYARRPRSQYRGDNRLLMTDATADSSRASSTARSASAISSRASVPSSPRRSSSRWTAAATTPSSPARRTRNPVSPTWRPATAR